MPTPTDQPCAFCLGLKHRIKANIALTKARTQPMGYAERLPEDWVEERRGDLVIRTDRRKYRPREVTVDTQGIEDDSGFRCHFIPAPFRFCLHCRVSYGMTIRSDFGALAELSSEGGQMVATGG